jgi:hypothetical protein
MPVVDASVLFIAKLLDPGVQAPGGACSMGPNMAVLNAQEASR